MQAVTIDAEFKALIPPLTDEELAALEQSILAEGCRDALVTWNGTLIDGHNRYEICSRHNLPFTTVEKEFASRDEAMDWMDANQLGRRNLKPDDRMMLIGRRYNRTKKAASGRSDRVFSGAQNEHPKTAESLAVQYGVGGSSIRRYGNIVTEAERIMKEEPEVDSKQAVVRAKAKINNSKKQEEPKQQEPERRPELSLAPHRKPFTNAAQFSSIAISQLTRIRDEDPQRVAALLEVKEYCEREMARDIKHKKERSK
jgi:hypothetical protein